MDGCGGGFKASTSNDKTENGMGLNDYFFGNGNGRHSRSKSASENKVMASTWDMPLKIGGRLAQEGSGDTGNKGFNDRGRLTKSQRRAALEQDVEKLQMRLQYEKSMRHTLEKAMGRASSAVSPGHHHCGSETAELVTEIAMLEEEVTNREQHVLSLYRNIFDQCMIGSLSTQNSIRTSPALSKREENIVSRISKALHSADKVSAKLFGRSDLEKGFSDANMQIHSKSMHSPSLNAHIMMDESGQSLESQTACKLQQGFDRISFDKQSNIMRYVLKERITETPNRLSEELVRCMADIYCKLSDPPVMHAGMPLSANSSVSFNSLPSPYDNITDGWSPRRKPQSFCNTSSRNPFHVKGDTRCIGPYSAMVEVRWICADKDQLAYATSMLQMFRSIVENLEKVDPSLMTRECKLAFWINIHNALVMHAYLAYGIPKSSLKRLPLFQKAAYKIGGYSISASTIERSILCCRTYHPAQWLETLLRTGNRIKMGEERRTFGLKYGLDEPEPLVYFALCGGGHSDPAVRVYTAKNVLEELEQARKEFLQASVYIHNKKKICLPKILERYVKAASINAGSLLQWISENAYTELADAIKCCIEKNPSKKSSHCVEWIPYDGRFRYIFARDLVPEVV